MLERLEGFGDDVVAVRARGLVTASDYQAVLVPAIESAVGDAGTTRLLLDFGAEFEGYDTSAMLADAGLGLKHLGSFERIALVTDADWMRRAIGLFGGLIPGEVRVFPAIGFEAAAAWIRE